MQKIIKWGKKCPPLIVASLILCLIFLLPPLSNLGLKFLKGTQWYGFGKLLITDIAILAAAVLVWKRGTRSPEPFLLLSILLLIRLSIYYAEPFSALMAGEYLKISTAGFLFLFLIMATSWVSSKKIVYFLMWMMTALGIVESLWALAQYINQADLGLTFLGERRFSAEISGTAAIINHKGVIIRSHGNFDHPNALGGFLVLSILTTGSLILQNSKKIRALLILGLCAQGLGIATTYSRSAWMGLTLAVIIWVVQMVLCSKGRFKDKLFKLRYFFLAIGLVFSVCCLCFSEDILHRTNLAKMEKTEGAFTRIKNCFAQDGERSRYKQIAEKMIENKPLTGVGFTNFVRKTSSFLGDDLGFSQYLPVHNIYYLIAAEIGLPALAFFIIFILLLLRGLFEEPLTPFAAIFAAYLVIGCFDNYFITMQAGRFIFFVVCAGIVLQRVAFQDLPSKSATALE